MVRANKYIRVIDLFFKIIGSIFIIFSTVLFSMYFESVDKYRIEDLEEIKKGFNLFSSNMEYTHLPLSEVFFDISSKLQSTTSEIFKRTSELLNQQKFETASMCWEEALKEYEKQSYFTVDDINAFLYFGKTLGYLDSLRQVKNGRYAVEYIDMTLERLIKKYDKSKKVYKSFGILSGLLIVIVLF